jgi:hypothetical protein
MIQTGLLPIQVLLNIIGTTVTVLTNIFSCNRGKSGEFFQNNFFVWLDGFQLNKSQ